MILTTNEQKVGEFMDYTSDIEMAFDDHPEQVNLLVQAMKDGTEEEAMRALTGEVQAFHQKLMNVIQNSSELSDFQKSLAKSILGYVQDNEYNEKEMQRLSNRWLLGNYPHGIEE